MIKSATGIERPFRRVDRRVDRIVCLANSYKHDHRCVAGISLITNTWVRLIGKAVPGCLTRQEASYFDGTEAAIFDVFEAEIGNDCGTNSHPEDVSISGEPWCFIRRFDQPGDARLLAGLVTKGPSLLSSSGDRLYRRKLDHSSIENSLELVHPEDLWWWIKEEKGKRRNRALFRLGHAGRTRYDLPVTDPQWLERLHLLPAGIYPHVFFSSGELPETFLTISLSEAFEGFHYKLVAGVMSFPGNPALRKRTRLRRLMS